MITKIAIEKINQGTIKEIKRKIKKMDTNDVPFGIKNLNILTRYFIVYKNNINKILLMPEYNKKTKSIFGVKIIFYDDE